MYYDAGKVNVVACQQWTYKELYQLSTEEFTDIEMSW